MRTDYVKSAAPIGGGGIPQDNIIFAFLLLSFVLFITIKGEFSTYMKFFTPGSQLGPQPVPVTGQSSANTWGNPGISSNPFAGLPTSWQEFFQLPSLTPSVSPQTGQNVIDGLGNLN